MEKNTKKRISKKIRHAYVMNGSAEELGKALEDFFNVAGINEVHILTYKDRIEVFACKGKRPVEIELYEKVFGMREEELDEFEKLRSEKNKL